MNRQLFGSNMLNNLKILNGFGVVDDAYYKCPLCMSQFSDETAMRLLTEEDVPQAALGGKRIALTCRHCNSTCGHTIDVSLINTIIAIENKYYLARTERNVNVLKEGKRLNAKLRIDTNRDMFLDIDTKRNNPKIWAEYKYNILLENAIMDLHDVPQKRNDRQFSAAILKNAYLLLFAQTGYTILSDSFYDRLRDQINNPQPFILPEGLWTLQNLTISDGIYLSKDNRIRGFFVVYTLTKVLRHRVCVFIPSPNVPYEAATFYLKQILPSSRVPIEKLFPYFDFLNNKEDIIRLRKWCFGWSMKFS